MIVRLFEYGLSDRNQILYFENLLNRAFRMTFFLFSPGLLRIRMQEIWSTPGNCHWGTVTDVAMLADALDIGFIIFPNSPFGRNHERWMYGVHTQKRNFPYWVMLYCEHVTHFLLAEVATTEAASYTCFFSDVDLPSTLRDHWSLCNPASLYHGGLS